MEKETEIKLHKFSAKVLRRARMMVESFRTIEGRNVRRVATGELAESLSSEIKDGGISFTSAKQGYWVEYGRKPTRSGGSKGQSKLRPAIRAWMREKGIVPRSKDGRFKPMTEANLNGLAYIIARKIHKKGYKGIYFFNTSIMRELEKPNNDLQGAMTDEVRLKTIKALRRKLPKATIK